MADQRLWHCRLWGYVFDPVGGDADGDVRPADDFLLQDDVEA
jgi:rubredoxin